MPEPTTRSVPIPIGVPFRPQVVPCRFRPHRCRMGVGPYLRSASSTRTACSEFVQNPERFCRSRVDGHFANMSHFVVDARQDCGLSQFGRRELRSLDETLQHANKLVVLWVVQVFVAWCFHCSFLSFQMTPNPSVEPKYPAGGVCSFVMLLLAGASAHLYVRRHGITTAPRIHGTTSTFNPTSRPFMPTSAAKWKYR